MTMVQNPGCKYIECKTKRKSVSVYSIFYNHFIIEFPHSFLWDVLKVER